MDEIPRALLRLLERGAAIPLEHDPEWPSPCEVLPPDEDGMVRWRPVAMDPPPRFDGLMLHPDLRAFFGSFWGSYAHGQHSGEKVLLVVAWNTEELARILQAIAEQLAEAVPVCIAQTDSDWYFGVDNLTGAVWLCEPGRPPIRQVASSLATFLSEIT